jgi:sterol desaturase/sphingolipid hydroxylase (fatty acid hydroxylase superfamily)
MHITSIQNKGQARLFKNAYLEYLTKTSPIVIWLLYLPLVIYLPYVSAQSQLFSFSQIIMLFTLGLISWTLAEYLLHRFLFHANVQGSKSKRIQYILHGNHHHFPRDKQRLFMPPVPSIFLASVWELFFFGLMGIGSLPFFSGFLLGYLLYGTMHYAIHAIKPPFSWMKPLWRNHHLHHYKEEEKGFGVSSTLWDRVFGTMYEKESE